MHNKYILVPIICFLCFGWGGPNTAGGFISHNVEIEYTSNNGKYILQIDPNS
jgi:hypothetical protein